MEYHNFLGDLGLVEPLFQFEALKYIRKVFLYQPGNYKIFFYYPVTTDRMHTVFRKTRFTVIFSTI